MVLVMVGMLLSLTSVLMDLTTRRRLKKIQRSVTAVSSLPDVARELENVFSALVATQQKLEMSYRHGLRLPVTICQEINHSVFGLQGLVDQLHQLARIPRLFQVHPVVEQSAMARSMRIQQAYEMV